ncbi:substrate-binding domain-containing protein [Streptomyces zhihengii]|uniref:Substrate-binding domain-containing protein n=1 Tax=Streptomyces zhihengii TaxID=1818004 RepID=A0ABS2US29_9ACTN|nr:substrate-binding domain-containing protein [Streptomyces zhihengii]MBM9620312.1 substrate-binding domain-containing protein [Streptomyces zhihengii]
MEWLSPENVVAVTTALLGVLVSCGVLWYERRVPRRRRIGYRVQMDTAIGSSVRAGRPNFRLGLFNEAPEMADATLVLLRIENDGSQSIAGDDYTGREIHGLSAEFTGRTVRAIAVTQPRGAEHLMDHFTAAAGMRHSGAVIHLPRVPLNQGQHFKLLVLLTGGPVGGDITVTGGIRDGDVLPNRAVPTDERLPLFSRAARLVTVLLTVCVVTLASIIVARDDDRPPMGCATGTVTLTGSTAFEPVLTELAEKYEKDCAGSSVEVDAHGSTAGIRALADAGAAAKGGSPAMIALSDGPKPGGHPALREHRVAVSVFTLVVNDAVPLRDLSLEDVRRLYRGEITDWRQIDGVTGLPVRLVSRDANSGTREVFQRRVLHRNEPASSSRDCVTKDDPEAPVVRCELDGTRQVLAAVAAHEGAIGYSELRAGDDLKGLHRLTIDGDAPSVDTIGTGDYPYREIEYAYTYGRPPADSLVSAFLAWMSRGGGQDVITTHGHLPCATPRGLRICGEDGP